MIRSLARLAGPVLVFLLVPADARAADPSAAFDVPAGPAARIAAVRERSPVRPRAIGDDIATAIPVPALPFEATGSTCTFADDYDEACPYAGSDAPDVVYAYTDTEGWWLSASLCDSAYDTKLFVYENDASTLVACNDDACGSDGFRSAILPFPMTAGSTYYVVVDGYGGGCGSYVLQMNAIVPEIVPCPPGALPEGEPDCFDGYVDEVDGGCAVLPEPAFFPLAGTPDGSPVSVCGTSGTYVLEGTPYRDTDWYELSVMHAETVTFEGMAQFPLLLLLIDAGGGCGALDVVASASAGAFPDVASFAFDCTPGTYWFWVGPSVFTGIPCGSDYAFTITGYTGEGPIPVRATSWGRLKGWYRGVPSGG